MDHTSCKKRIDHLEDELDYNYERKESLKNDVKRLEKLVETLQEANFKNAEFTMSLTKEIRDLKSIVESLEHEKVCLIETVNEGRKM